MRRFLIRWIINAAALGAAAWLLDGIRVDDGVLLFLVALVFGLVNSLIRPILKLLTCPLILLTLGLFTLVINALMLLLTSWISEQLALGFSVHGFWTAFWGGLIVSIVSFLLSTLLDERDR